jgi:diguanylate cyclase (GGDEF)-like protein
MRSLARPVALWFMAIGANTALFLLIYRWAGDAAALSSVLTILLYSILGEPLGTVALSIALFPLHALLYCSKSHMTVEALLADGRYYFGTGGIAALGFVAAYVKRLVTDLKEARATLQRLSTNDPVTELPNRKALAMAIKYALARSSRRSHYRFAVACVEVNRAGRVGTAWGNAAGDELLRQIGQRLLGVIRTGDRVARTGDSEFTLLLDDLRAHEDVLRVVFALEQALRQPFEVGRREVFVSSLVGVTIGGPPYADPEDILRDTRLAVQRAREEGPDRHAFFDPQLHARSQRALEIEVALRQALDGQELSLYCQPIVEIASQRLDSFEVLLRWNRPGEGFIPPSEFIPIAEATGLIVPIGEWVARTVCAYLARLEAAGAGSVPASMNLSPVHLSRPRIADYLRTVLAHHGIDPRRLHLEITESAIVGEGSASGAALAIATSGIQLSVDDFGVGYSCLGYLSRLPVHRIKLDRSFVQGIGRIRADEDLIRAVAAMASGLSRELIVEGVENEDQLRFLKAVGCGLAQGYLFARPMPFAEFERTWASRAAASGPGVSPDDSE